MGLLEILNPEGHPNRSTGSKIMAILLNDLILPVVGVALGRVCAQPAKHDCFDQFTFQSNYRPTLSIRLKININSNMLIFILVLPQIKFKDLKEEVDKGKPLRIVICAFAIGTISSMKYDSSSAID